MQPRRIDIELLMGTITHRHHQRRSTLRSRQQLGTRMSEVETGTSSRGDCAGMYTISRVGTGTVGWLLGQPGPQRRGELRASRVASTDEDRRLG